MKKKLQPRSVIVISDTHCGCRMGLFPNHPMMLDGGTMFGPSRLQQKVWAYWRHFWDEWVPEVTKGGPFILVVNGDAMDGDHHGSKTQVSHNYADQQAIALACLRPVVGQAAAYFHLRGTEAHSGPSGEQEELLARALGAIPDAEGNHARWDLRLDLWGNLCHFCHTVGVTGSAAYKSTAPYKELNEALAESGKSGRPAPRVLVRSHRHGPIEVREPTASGDYIVAVSAGWQLKTPYVYRLASGRACPPSIGGLCIRVGDRILYTESKVWDVEPPLAEVYGA